MNSIVFYFSRLYTFTEFGDSMGFLLGDGEFNILLILTTPLLTLLVFSNFKWF